MSLEVKQAPTAGIGEASSLLARQRSRGNEPFWGWHWFPFIRCGADWEQILSSQVLKMNLKAFFFSLQSKCSRNIFFPWFSSLISFALLEKFWESGTYCLKGNELRRQKGIWDLFLIRVLSLSYFQQFSVCWCRIKIDIFWWTLTLIVKFSILFRRLIRNQPTWRDINGKQSPGFNSVHTAAQNTTTGHRAQNQRQGFVLGSKTTSWHWRIT